MDVVNNFESIDLVVQKVIEFVEMNGEKLEKRFQDLRRDRIKEYTRKISEEEYIRNLPRVSVVVLTANEYEETALNYYAYRNQKNPSSTPILKVENKVSFKNDNIKFTAYYLNINSYYILHLHAMNTGSYTTGGSSDLIRYVAENELIHATCIISFGICFGHSCIKQNLCDTIIAKKLYPYFVGVKLKDGSVEVKSDDFTINLVETNPYLYEKIDLLFEEGILGEYSENTEGHVYRGEMITGEAVISDEMYKKIFEDAANINNPKGGEMEGYGLGKECFFYNIPGMLIKSICDWGVAKNIDEKIYDNLKVNKGKDKIQAYASYCAYTVLEKLFQENVFDESLYDNFKRKFIQKYQYGATNFIPQTEVNEEFTNYNNNLKNGTKTYKKISDLYIKRFCELMEADRIWKMENNNSIGYIKC